MNLQGRQQDGKGGVAFRTVSSMLLITATALLVGSLITAHSAKTSPNSGRVTPMNSISLVIIDALDQTGSRPA